MSDQDGGAAFPSSMSGYIKDTQFASSRSIQLESSGGMWLRDYFAGQALAGLAANEIFVAFVRGFHKGQSTTDGEVSGLGIVSMTSEAYRIADQMLKARAVQP